MRCYLCGRNEAQHLAPLRDSFTAHGSARSPHSQEAVTTGRKTEIHYHLCGRCHDLVVGESSRCWYWNPSAPSKRSPGETGEWSLLWTRGTSWLMSADQQCPRIGEFIEIAPIDGKTGKPKTPMTLRQIFDLPTYGQIRQWLLDPPTPPFRIVIAESGKKHIDFLAPVAYCRDRFPVQFELDTLQIDRAEFTQILSAFESLMAAGFSKTEILTGQYRSDRLARSLPQYRQHEPLVSPHRETRLLALTKYVAQLPEP